MPVITDRLRQYGEAIKDPTRGAILVELDRLGEATPTQLGRRLGVPANNIYHHIRVLRQLQVVDEPRAVASDSYVEKYYKINPALRAALRLDPDWYTGETITAEDRQTQLVSMCLTMATLLRAAARDLEHRDAEELDREIQEHKHLVLSINRVSREQLNFRLNEFRDVLDREEATVAADTSPRTDMMLMATIPDLWSSESPDGVW